MVTFVPAAGMGAYDPLQQGKVGEATPEPREAPSISAAVRPHQGTGPGKP